MDIWKQKFQLIKNIALYFEEIFVKIDEINLVYCVNVAILLSDTFTYILHIICM